MAVFFCMILVLAVQLAIRGNQRAMEKSLHATQQALQQQILEENAREKYLLSQKFTEEYILKIMGWAKVK